jgi:hypothetical protein
MKRIWVLFFVIVSGINLNAISFKENISNEYLNINVNYYYFKDDNRIDISIEAINLHGNGKGGISISIPELKTTDLIKSQYSQSFKKIDTFKAGSKVWNNTLKKAISSEYLLVEGWSDKWKRNDSKYMFFSVDTKSLKSLTLQIRSNLIVGKEKVSTPSSGIVDQQGFPIKNINLSFDELFKRDKYSFITKTDWEKDIDTLYLVNKETKEEKKILVREHISGAGFACQFYEMPVCTESGNLIATYICDGVAVTNAGYDRSYTFSTNGDLLKEEK